MNRAHLMEFFTFCSKLHRNIKQCFNGELGIKLYENNAHLFPLVLSMFHSFSSLLKLRTMKEFLQSSLYLQAPVTQHISKRLQQLQRFLMITNLHSNSYPLRGWP